MEVDFARPSFGDEERAAVNRVMEGHWLASGDENEKFESEFAAYVGRRHSVCVNSGSMANLLSLASLELPRGSKVITSACGFPATLAPILHLGLEPVLVDYDISTFNIDIGQVAMAMASKGVRAVILAHTMGNPVDLSAIKSVCDRRGIFIVEDCCEAIGARIHGNHLGHYGTLSTYSFYPSHQITALGGGGMITVDDTDLAMRLKSLRDWGKAWYWNDRLGKNITEYDNVVDGIEYFQHYVYHSLGYNAKLPEANAAFGREQLKRLDSFVERRLDNYTYIRRELDHLSEIFRFPIVSPYATPSWFGFPLVFREPGEHPRKHMTRHLEGLGIRTRPFFAGNITRHLPFLKYKRSFPVADKLMEAAFFFGCYQGMTSKQINYVIDKVKEGAKLYDYSDK